MGPGVETQPPCRSETVAATAMDDGIGSVGSSKEAVLAAAGQCYLGLRPLTVHLRSLAEWPQGHRHLRLQQIENVPSQGWLSKG